MLSTCWSSTARTGDRGPLEERKAMLKKLLAKAPAGIRYSEHLEGDSAAIFAHTCKLGAEGIVSKHREHRRQIAIQIQNCLYNWWVSKSERGRFRHVRENSGLLTLEHVHKHRRSFCHGNSSSHGLPNADFWEDRRTLNYH
jgi:hypothetical protein